MSLFEDNNYRWRETYFVLFQESQRPQAEQVKKAIKELDKRYEIRDLSQDDHGNLESLTLVSPFDFAAMDITYLAGEDVIEQIGELTREMKDSVLTSEERSKLARLREFNARFDVYHFEYIMNGDEQEEDEFLDPGSLLIVLERLARICDGVSVDPQSGTVL